MDLSSPKVGSDEKLALCKKYFFIGFAFLPLLWAVNAVWLVNASYSVSKLGGLVTFSRKCHHGYFPTDRLDLGRLLQVRKGSIRQVQEGAGG